jgi:hypothetical protein
MMKGQQEALTVVLISGILISVVGSVYLWGLPMIQKSMDVSTLENSENFVMSLNEKIKYVANNGGREQLRITVPGTVTFDDGKMELSIETQGTIYATAAQIPLGKNYCTATQGSWGINDPETLCVVSQKLGDNKYVTKYELKYIELRTQSIKSYKIMLVGSTSSGGMDHMINIENKGTSEENNLINTIIEIKII